MGGTNWEGTKGTISPLLMGNLVHLQKGEAEWARTQNGEVKKNKNTSAK